MPLADVRRVLEHHRNLAVVDGLLRTHLVRLEQGLDDARRELSAARSLLVQESPMTTVPSRITTTAGELRTGLRAVRYAVGTDPELPMLAGVLLDADDSAARLAASDRYRLAVSTLTGAEMTGPPVSVIVPVALIDELLALLPDSGPVTIDLVGDELTVEFAGRTLRGQRLDHDFPDYRGLLRETAAHRFDIDAAGLRASLAAAPTRLVRAGDDGPEHEATVLTFGADGGIEIGVNKEFLLEAIDAGRPGQLVLELDGPIEPLAIRVSGRTGDVAMLMPIRLT
jgi:DNA polymerase III sliding clamp (beta) subunit (PCNA family)